MDTQGAKEGAQDALNKGAGQAKQAVGQVCVHSCQPRLSLGVSVVNCHTSLHASFASLLSRCHNQGLLTAACAEALTRAVHKAVLRMHVGGQGGAQGHRPGA